MKNKGEYEVFMLAPDVTEDSHVVARLRDVARGKVRGSEREKIIRDLKNQRVIKKMLQIRNIVPVSGRNVFTRLLTGDDTYSGEINYIALGSGNTAFTGLSTQLNTEVFRKLVSDAAQEDNIAFIDVFIASGDVGNQTFNEVGAFIDGTGDPNTGRAFSLALTGGWVKTGSMFISLKVTLT